MIVTVQSPPLGFFQKIWPWQGDVLLRSPRGELARLNLSFCRYIWGIFVIVLMELEIIRLANLIQIYPKDTDRAEDPLPKSSGLRISLSLVLDVSFSKTSLLQFRNLWGVGGGGGRRRGRRDRPPVHLSRCSAATGRNVVGVTVRIYRIGGGIAVSPLDAAYLLVRVSLSVV